MWSSSSRKRDPQCRPLCGSTKLQQPPSRRHTSRRTGAGMYRDRRAWWGACALPAAGPAGADRERPSSCATLARFAGEDALQPRSATARAVGMLWSAGGVGRSVGTVALGPRSAADFAAAGLARTEVLPPQVSRPDGGADSAATAEVPAPPIPRAGSFADSAAGGGVLPRALVPSGGDTPGRSCAPRFAGEVAPPAGPSWAFGSGAWPALASRRLPPRPRRGLPGSQRCRPSCTSRPTSCPTVRCGSTRDSSARSCSIPR